MVWVILIFTFLASQKFSSDLEMLLLPSSSMGTKEQRPAIYIPCPAPAVGNQDIIFGARRAVISERQRHL